MHDAGMPRSAGDTIWIKGSRGSAMERVIKHLIELTESTPSPVASLNAGDALCRFSLREKNTNRPTVIPNQLIKQIRTDAGDALCRFSLREKNANRPTVIPNQLIKQIRTEAGASASAHGSFSFNTPPIQRHYTGIRRSLQSFQIILAFCWEQAER